MSFLNQQNFFGLDISESALRAVKIIRKGKKNIMVSFNEVSLSEDTIVEGQIKKEQEFSKALQKLIKETQGKDFKTNRVLSVLPESKTFIKIIYVTAKENEDIQEAIKKEIPNNIPVTIEEVYFDWEIISKSKKNSQETLYTVLLGVAPKIIVDEYTTLLQKNNLIVDGLEIEASAICRCLLQSLSENKAFILVDFGAVRTSLIFFDKKAIQFTISLPISGKKITNVISETLKIHNDEAEKAKIVCGLDEQKCQGVLRKILSAHVETVKLKIEEAMQFYKDFFPEGNKVEKIYLSGGGSQLLGIEGILTRDLHVLVEKGNPFTHIHKINHGIEIQKNKYPSITTAIGLALKNIIR